MMDNVVSRVSCLGCYRIRILLISRETRVIRDKMTTVYKCVHWRFIYSNYDTISELAVRSRQRPNTEVLIIFIMTNFVVSK